MSCPFLKERTRSSIGLLTEAEEAVAPTHKGKIAQRAEVLRGLTDPIGGGYVFNLDRIDSYGARRRSGGAYEEIMKFQG